MHQCRGNSEVIWSLTVSVGDALGTAQDRRPTPGPSRSSSRAQAIRAGPQGRWPRSTGPAERLRGLPYDHRGRMGPEKREFDRVGRGAGAAAAAYTGRPRAFLVLHRDTSMLAPDLAAAPADHGARPPQRGRYRGAYGGGFAIAGTPAVRNDGLDDREASAASPHSQGQCAGARRAGRTRRCSACGGRARAGFDARGRRIAAAPAGPEKFARIQDAIDGRGKGKR